MDRRRSSRTSGSGGGGGPPRRKSSADGGGGSATTPTKKKKKKPRSAAEDALEAKMKAKKKKEKSSSKAEDALEAKIRKKNQQAAASAARGGGEESYSEEEKIEEGMSVSEGGDSYDDNKPSASRYKTSSAPPPPENNALFTRGGGDVRNKPPPNLANQTAAIDPLRQAELEKQKNKKEVNKRYADLHQTGQWGGLTKWEKYGICLLTLGAIAAAVVLGIKFGSGGPKTESPTPSPTKSPTLSPSLAPTMNPTENDYRENTGLDLMKVVSPKLTLPLEPEALVGAKTRADSTPQEIAAEFVIYDDPMELSARDPRFMERYALVVLYYQNGGCAGDWNTNTNWMVFDEDADDVAASADHCNDWHGIVCDLKGRVIEVNLSQNYVTGKIPVEFSQLLELGTLDLSNNAMVGTVPAEALSMSKMYTIRLNNNMFEGEFPFEEVKDGATILGKSVVVVHYC